MNSSQMEGEKGAATSVEVVDVDGLLKNGVPYLCIPFEIGFRKGSLQDKLGIEKVVYEYEKKLFENEKKVAKWLQKKNYGLSVGCFSFDLGIDVWRRQGLDDGTEMLILEDFAIGKERFKIPALCSKDVLPLPKVPDITYVEDLVISESLQNADLNLHPSKEALECCCECTDNCRDKSKCACQLKTLESCHKEVRNEIGDKNVGYYNCRLMEQLSSGIFECHDGCKCVKEACNNRVSQNGILFPLQLVHYGEKGWGVRASVDMPRGSFICMYLGEVISEEKATELETEVGPKRCSYFAELKLEDGSTATCAEEEEEDKHCIEDQIVQLSSQQSNSSSTQKSSETLASTDTPSPMSTSSSELSSNSSEQLELNSCFILDGFSFGSIGGFLNHSCDPNSFAQFVFWDNRDPRLPRIALFTCKTIQAGDELTWDYKYSHAQVNNGDKEERVTCLCQAEGCRGILF